MLGRRGTPPGVLTFGMDIVVVVVAIVGNYYFFTLTGFDLDPSPFRVRAATLTV